MLKASILILSLIVVLVSVDGCRRRMLNIDTTSPETRYRIQLTETYTKAISEKDPWPYKVFMKAERNGQVFLSNEILDHYDDWDVGLGQIATDSEWLSDNILRLGSRAIKEDQQYDWIEVRNNSGSTLSYALISGISTIPGEKFLLFDLKPSEDIRLKVFAQTDRERDYSWINFMGKVENQHNKVISNGKRFKVQGKYKSPSHYSIIVNDSNVEIKSLEYESID